MDAGRVCTICRQSEPASVLPGFYRYGRQPQRRSRLTRWTEHGIEGEALVALKHEELKEMGIASVGHRLTILKNVYDLKVRQDIQVEPDDYIPPSKTGKTRREAAR